MNPELEKVVKKTKVAQEKLHGLLKSQSWIEDARKFAEKQKKEVKKLISSDVNKVRSFLEKQTKELEKFQKQIPSEVKKVKKFVAEQRKDFDKLLANVRNGKFDFKASKAKVKKTTKKATSAKATGTKKKAAPSVSA